MGRKNKRLLGKEVTVKEQQEFRQARKTLRNWQREVGHLKPVLRGFSERQAG